MQYPWKGGNKAGGGLLTAFLQCDPYAPAGHFVIGWSAAECLYLTEEHSIGCRNTLLSLTSTLLMTLSRDSCRVTVLDLKEAFSTHSWVLNPKSAFEWEDGDKGVRLHYCWTVLPWGLTCSQYLKKSWPDSGDLELNREALLQDADDALITSETGDTWDQGTGSTSDFMAEWGCKVARKKADSQPLFNIWGF